MFRKTGYGYSVKFVFVRKRLTYILGQVCAQPQQGYIETVDIVVFIYQAVQSVWGAERRGTEFVCSCGTAAVAPVVKEHVSGLPAAQ